MRLLSIELQLEFWKHASLGYFEKYDPNGYIRTTYIYSPYGAVTAAGDVTQPIQWSSEFNDTELGLVYYNWAWQSGELGPAICL